MTGPSRPPDAAGPGDRELVVTAGPGRGEVFAFSAAGATLGSGAECEVRLEAAGVAVAHARIERRQDGFLWVRDLAGGAGTRLNGEPVAEARVHDGAILQLGEVELCLRARGTGGPHGTAMSGPRPQLAEPGEAPADALRSGEVLDGRYRILAKIGEGGMGEVYRGEHVTLGKPLAVKVLRRELSQDAELVQRFEREAVSATRIGQKNIVDVSDFGRTGDGRFYFVMEYLAGDTVAAVLRREESLPAERALPIVAQVCRALIAAHHKGILHRDIKSENLMLLERDGERDVVKVLDFGVAKVAGGSGDSLKTGVGAVVGTPAYMSPEQATGQGHDARSDIYSLGVVLYEMLAGRLPFSGPTPTHVMAAHITQPPPPLPERMPPVSAELKDLVMRMLAKKPEERPQSMAEVAAAVDGCLVSLGQVPAATPTLSLPPALRTWPQGVPPAAAPVADAALSVEERAAVGGPRRMRALVAVVVGIVVVGGGVALVAGRRVEHDAPRAPEPAATAEPPPAPTLAPPAAPAPVPAPAPRRIAVTIASTPPGAAVFEGKAALGRTPFSVSWEEGRRATVRFVLAGFRSETAVVEAHEGATVKVKLRRRGGRATDEGEPYGQVEDIKDAPY